MFSRHWSVACKVRLAPPVPAAMAVPVAVPGPAAAALGVRQERPVAHPVQRRFRPRYALAAAAAAAAILGRLAAVGRPAVLQRQWWLPRHQPAAAAVRVPAVLMAPAGPPAMSRPRQAAIALAVAAAAAAMRPVATASRASHY